MAEPKSPQSEPLVAHLDALPVGTRLDEFEILRLLGVGGFGMVYEAYDHSLQRSVAIKEYMPSALVGRSAGLLLTIRSAADNQTFAAGLKSFMAEARMLAQFDHPSLVKVFRFWEAHNTAYMVMPLYSGMTFAQARAQMRNPPTEAWLRKLLWSLLGALRVLHDASTVHRDVSPDNIFLQDVGPPVLLDLGAARRAITDQSHKLTAVLKVNYAPIEQYAGAGDMQQGPWSDLYALAAVVHGAVGGAPPVPATFRVLQDRMLPFAEAARQAQTGQLYSPEFTEAIDRALVIRPEERTRSVDAFVQQMQLEPPEGGMARFDWRAGLVGGLVAAPDQLGTASGWATAPDAPTIVLPAPASVFATPLDQRTQQLAARVEAVDPNATLILPPAARVLAPPADDAAVTIVVPAPEPAPAPRKPSKPPMTLPPRAPAAPPKAVKPAKPSVPEPSAKSGTGWLLVLLLVSIAAVAGGVWWMGQPAPSQSTQPARSAAPAVAESVVPAQAPAAVPAVAASALQPEPVAESTAAASAGSATTPVAVVSEPAASAAAVRRASSAPVAARRDRAPEPKTRVEPAAAPAHGVPTPAPAEAPVRRAEPVAAPATMAGALCANSSVLGRSACVHSECQKPANTNHPACVALRSQQQASELYRN